jgi:hypothetical protein
LESFRMAIISQKGHFFGSMLCLLLSLKVRLLSSNGF